jgi:RimJ/RimL family protein N-acetyltransferase
LAPAARIFQENQTLIQTQRLIIRPFRATDFTGLFEYLSNPLVYQFEPGAPITLAEAQALAVERAGQSEFWAVALQTTDQIVGHLYFSQIDPHHLQTWELGYIFNPAHQRQGYASEAAAALVRHGFAAWGIHRVVAHCSPENTASWRLLERIGMHREGYFRKNIYFKTDASGRPLWLDTLAYALLEQDLPLLPDGRMDGLRHPL